MGDLLRVGWCLALACPFLRRTQLCGQLVTNGVLLQLNSTRSTSILMCEIEGKANLGSNFIRTAVFYRFFKLNSTLEYVSENI